MAEKEQENEAKEKPLEKMTATELRGVAKEIPGISGVHGMKKAELLDAINAARGIKDEKAKNIVVSVGDIKLKIKALKIEREAALKANDKKMATIYRRRISRLKKKTRKAA